MGKYYKEFSDFLAAEFNGKMQKLTVNAGFTCPNRDGTLGRGGCAYCNNSSFSPSLAGPSVTSQLEEGKRFFARKYPEMRYLAYFQSYTNTHGEIDRLISLYREAIEVDGVDGLIIGTRPDCVSLPLIKRLKELGKWVMMEYGAESSHDETLERVNRCHSWRQTVEAVEMTASEGIHVGLHLIMGLPGESRGMMMETVRRVASLPLAAVKFHQLQIVKGTRLALELAAGELIPVSLAEMDGFEKGKAGVSVPSDGKWRYADFSVEEYLDLCEGLVRTLNELNPELAIERFTSQSPAELLISPRWGLKNYQFMNLLHNRLQSGWR